MKMFGLIGERLGHTYSPLIHREIYAAMGWKAEYGLFQVEVSDVSAVIPSLQVLGVSGVNVTIPYKVEMIPYLDTLTPEAEKIGAINTISLTKEGIVGDNTDYYGILRTFEEMGLSLSGKKVVILGNGGASKAVQAVLLNGGASFTILSIEDDGNPTPDILPTLGQQDLLINATPVGMYPNGGDCPVPKEAFAQFTSAFDVIYNPNPTRFVKEAKAAGLVTATGLPMLVYQAVRSEEIWFGETIPEEVVQGIIALLDRKVLEESL